MNLPLPTRPAAASNAACRRTAGLVLALATLVTLTGSAAAEEPLERFSASEPHMGTTVAITLEAPTEAAANAAFQGAFARFAELNAILSDYDSTSELSRLAAQAPTPHPVPVSDDLWRVLSAAQQLSERTDGAFDVTVGPLTKLWRRARRKHQLPDPELLAEARQAVGFRFVTLHPETQSVELARPNMRLDLGGIAKGYAVDAALATLRAAGVERALINAGGDLAASGPPTGERGWRVGIAPLNPQSPPERFLLIANQAVATSGDAWQFLELEGRRYSHILDPRTGLGLTYRGSVTIVAPNGMTADALASSVSVLSVEDGLRLVDATPGAAALIVRVESEEARTWESGRFAKLDFAPLP